MKVTHFVETTHERYTALVADYNALDVYGGRVDAHATDHGDAVIQVKTYHNPRLSDIGRRPEWILVALAILQRYHPEHSQYFVLEKVELGVTHKEVK